MGFFRHRCDQWLWCWRRVMDWKVATIDQPKTCDLLGGCPSPGRRRPSTDSGKGVGWERSLWSPLQNTVVVLFCWHRKTSPMRAKWGWGSQLDRQQVSPLKCEWWTCCEGTVDEGASGSRSSMVRSINHNLSNLNTWHASGPFLSKI